MFTKNMAKRNIYGNRINYKKELKRITKASISQANKNYIKNFLDCKLAENISETRAVKLGSELRNIASWLNKDFDQATKKDIQVAVRELNLRKDYSADTKKLQTNV